MKIEIRHENQNGSEYGYGLYINAYTGDYGDNSIWASECVSRDASSETIKAAEKRVRERARYHYRKTFSR